MCDYSLYAFPNRLADEGEELVLHRFETHTLGFVSASDLLNPDAANATQSKGFWAAISEWLFGPGKTQFTAVCVPPGTSLLLGELPQRVQKSLCIGPSQIVVFTEISDKTFSYRDALLLPNGTRVLLQDLPEGIHALVVSVSPESSRKFAHTELRVA